MVVIRKRPNTLVLPLVEGGTIVNQTGDSVFIYPGLNGNVPAKVAKNKTFIQQVEAGYLEVVDSGVKDAEEHENAQIDEVNEEAISAILNTNQANAIKLVSNIFKIVDIEAIEKKETRRLVCQAIKKQKLALGI